MLSEASKDPFRTRDHVAEFDDVVDAFGESSRQTRQKLRSETDVPYGDGPAEKLDIFYPPPAARQGRAGLPVHIFIHGGYWRMFSKDDFSYIADTVTAAGAIAVILDYALMPTQRMALLIDQVRRATAWVAREIGSRGGDPFSTSVSGHSAGAHLASWLVDQRDAHPDYRVATCLLLGGLYDLRPLQRSFLQPDLALTDEEVDRWTPLTVTHRADCIYSIHVGEYETTPFHDQAARFHQSLLNDGCTSALGTVPATNHMTSALSLGNPASDVGKSLMSTIHKSQANCRPSK
ncbi:alpha/beta hydrolase [Dongia soli]|uniref:Alpha/beta hydrolase n=1 Tax=Dongia soli TaxID=600628 RepID=A0ABU5E5E6_9PROT|nr:alpha/beta hydrolase [Dongia soli]MDY0881490.1 alpha/beta hydrolase [Dongia soli]